MKPNFRRLVATVTTLLSVLLGGLYGSQSVVAADHLVTEATEDKLRAAMLVGIVRYTHWVKDYGATLTICLAGKSSSFEHIRALDGSQLLSEKNLKVVSYAPREPRQSCQVVVYGQAAPKNGVSSVAEPCLFVCDGCGQVKKDTAVVLRKVSNRIRFDVDLNNAKKQGVRFRASMLELAASVVGSDG